MTTPRIPRRAFVGAMAAGAGALAAAPQSLPAMHRRVLRRPNIVLISADDLGYGDLSGYGRADYQTPVLDRLAAEGTRFTQGYAIAPVCTPTRVGLMTGRYPARHPVGLHEPLARTPEHLNTGLAASHPTISSLLRSAGYTNALFGKWHLGVAPAFHPNRHGFDEFFGPLGGAVDYVAHTTVAGEPDLYHNDRPVQVAGYLTDLLADEAVRFIGQRREPFFLSHQGTAPHSPWQRRGDPPAGRSTGPYDAGPADRFPDMVRALDEAAGRILVALERAKLVERTLVIFTSDNGGVRYSSMGGLAGMKQQLWEGGIRVPMFMRWPGVIPAGVTTTQVATTLDLSATILAAAGAAPAASHPLDGIDLLPILTGSEPVRERSVCWRTSRVTQHRAIRSGRWKRLHDGEREYLFDLALDPGERHDRAADEPRRLEGLRGEYEAWEREMLPPLYDGRAR
ncbi:MAG: sulfatase-like hydrolase/transferase [Gemmatimonadota bacterium]|nr:sulfatase-like hydrolase/transferase [Gemmatimonadota bacterium]